MKRLLLWLYFFLFLQYGAISGCGKIEESGTSGSVALTLSSEKSFLLDAKSSKCDDSSGTQSLSSYSVRGPKLKITYNGTGALEVVYIKVTLSGANTNETTYTFSDTEMKAMYSTTSFLLVPATNLAPTANILTDGCGIKLGGIALSNEKVKTTITAKVKVAAIETIDNEPRSVSATESFTIEWEP